MIRARKSPQPKAPWTRCFPDQIQAREPKPRKRIGTSKKRKSDAVIYERKKAAHFKAHPDCQLCGGKIHMAIHRENHHLCGRAGSLYTDDRFFRTAHSWCHAWTHANPNAAVLEGWLAPTGVFNDPRRAEKWLDEQNRNGK